MLPNIGTMDGRGHLVDVVTDILQLLGQRMEGFKAELLAAAIRNAEVPESEPNQFGQGNAMRPGYRPGLLQFPERDSEAVLLGGFYRCVHRWSGYVTKLQLKISINE